MPDESFVPFQRNYRFTCRICKQGPEEFEVQSNTWTSIVVTAMYNLLLCDDNSSLRAGAWIKVSEIVDWLKEHWGSLAAGSERWRRAKCRISSSHGLYTNLSPEIRAVEAWS